MEEEVRAKLSWRLQECFSSRKFEAATSLEVIFQAPNGSRRSSAMHRTAHRSPPGTGADPSQDIGYSTDELRRNQSFLDLSCATADHTFPSHQG